MCGIRNFKSHIKFMVRHGQLSCCNGEELVVFVVSLGALALGEKRTASPHDFPFSVFHNVTSCTLCYFFIFLKIYCLNVIKQG